MSTNGANGTNGNGTNAKLLWWLIGGIITPIIITALSTIAGDSKRVTAIETMFNEVERRLGRMETKLEKLLERRP